jgi:hypothetical protein
MKAVSVHGGDDTSWRISSSVGGLTPMTQFGDDPAEGRLVLMGVWEGVLRPKTFSKAEEGRGGGC